jgi:hypothetical protein
MSQDDKIFLNLAGEFAVASELNRRKLLASVTHGTSKSADIFVLNSSMSKIARVEVKTTEKNKWVVGQRALNPKARTPDVFWALVYLPSALKGAASDDEARGLHSPRFFVLTSTEVYDLAHDRHTKYSAKYEKKHGSPYEMAKGVSSLTRDQVSKHEARWDKIERLMRV